MRNILTSFWINIIASLAFSAIAAYLAKSQLGLNIQYSLGFIIITFFVVFTILSLFKKNNSDRLSDRQEQDNIQVINAGVIKDSKISNVSYVGDDEKSNGAFMFLIGSLIKFWRGIISGKYGGKCYQDIKSKKIEDSVIINKLTINNLLDQQMNMLNIMWI